ncbi:MAG: DUF2884 family protein [Dokdonella sp.]
MQRFCLLLAFFLFVGAHGARADDDFSDVCHASSSYDLTVTPDSLVFDRAEAAPRRIELRAGNATLDGAKLSLNTEDRDRLLLFEQELRTLIPKARTVARNGVDLAIKAMQAETAAIGASAETLAALDASLASRGGEIKRRIAASASTHDWQGDVIDRYATDIAADIAPLIAADLGQQAIAAALEGDGDAAAALRERAADLSGNLRPRLERRMQALRPQIEALCPSIRRLSELQRGVRGADGRPLDMLEVQSPKKK